MKRQELQVAALQNGTVIDPRPSNKLFQVVNLLHLANVKTAVTVGYNLKSKKMGHKSIIKIADKFFTDEELNQLAVITPNVSRCMIRDYEEVEEKTVELADNRVGIIKCNNRKCITNNEPMLTRFHVLDHATGTVCCHYCNTQQHLDEVKLCQ